MSGLLPCVACSRLETRVAELERKVDDLVAAVRPLPDHRRRLARTCERCKGGVFSIARCVNCERDLCRPCLGTETCSHSFSKEHHA